MKTVLVAEDSDLSRSLITLALGDRAGLRILEARDGEEAWTLLLAEEVNLVLTDLNMPRLDGVDLIRRVRSEPRLSTLPVVMITTVGEVEERVRAVAPDAYLTKPVDAQDLDRLLDQFLVEDDAPPVAEATRGLLLLPPGPIRDELRGRLAGESGATVYEAETSLEAIGQVFLNDLDFAVVDLQLPDHHGPQFVRQLRKSPAYQRMLLFLMADKGTRDDLVELGALGATKVIGVEQGASGAYSAVCDGIKGPLKP